MEDWNEIIRKTLEPCDPTHQLEENLRDACHWYTTFPLFILRAFAIRESKICRPDDKADKHTKLVAHVKREILAQVANPMMLLGNTTCRYLISSSIISMTDEEFIDITKELIIQDLGFKHFELIESFSINDGNNIVHYIFFKFSR